MKKRKITFDKKRIRIAAAALAICLGFSSLPNVYASAISDAQDKKEQAESELDSLQDNISGIENKKDTLQVEIEALDSELVGIIANMSILEDELAAKQIQLDEVNVELADAEETEQIQYENMKKRIRYMYENGETNYLSVILGATDFGDFLNRVEYAKQVYDYDRELLTTYQETKQQVADLKTQVEGEKAELEQMQASYQEQEEQYRTMIAEKQTSLSDFDVQLAEAEDLAAQYKSVIAQQNAVIQQEQERLAQEQQRLEEEERQRQEAAAAAAAAAASNNSNNNSNSNTNSNSSSNNNSSSTTGIGTGSSTSSGSGESKNPAHTTNISGSEVVSYACQFIGNPYVYGGVSLTNGCDCSGFVMSVYANFGISLPHNSYALQSVGSEVSYANAQPGDLICYAGHVAIYTGGGQIVNASSSAPYPVGGIKTNTATYRQILTVRRVL